MTTYQPRHADLSETAKALCDKRDEQNALTFPCQHHRPRHSAFVGKVRVLEVGVA